MHTFLPKIGASKCTVSTQEKTNTRNTQIRDEMQNQLIDDDIWLRVVAMREMYAQSQGHEDCLRGLGARLVIRVSFFKIDRESLDCNNVSIVEPTKDRVLDLRCGILQPCDECLQLADLAFCPGVFASQTIPIGLDRNKVFHAVDSFLPVAHIFINAVVTSFLDLLDTLKNLLNPGHVKVNDG